MICKILILLDVKTCCSTNVYSMLLTSESRLSSWPSVFSRFFSKYFFFLSKSLAFLIGSGSNWNNVDLSIECLQITQCCRSWPVAWPTPVPYPSAARFAPGICGVCPAFAWAAIWLCPAPLFDFVWPLFWTNFPCWIRFVLFWIF